MTPVMPRSIDPAPQPRELPVRYYPRRVRRSPAPRTLTPSQALHLVRDEGRAARAASTADGRSFVAPRATQRSRWRRWWRRIRG